MGTKSTWLALAIIWLSLTVSAPGSAPQVVKGAGVAGEEPQLRMTNAEVIRLVKDHQPEAETIRRITAAVQSGRADFDLSPNALIALHNAGVSNNVLKAMMAAGSAQNSAATPAGSPTAAPANPGTTSDGRKPTAQQSQKMLAHLKQRPGHMGAMITNPQADQAEATVLASLTQVPAQPHQLLFATPGTPSSSSDPAAGTPGGSTPAGTPGSNPTGGQPRSGSTGNSGNPSGGQPGMAGPSPTRSSMGTLTKNSTLLTAAAAAPPKSSSGIPTTIPKGANINPCVISGAPVVTEVTGYRIGLSAFSQDPSYNPYTITGCNFGANAGRAFLGLPPSGSRFTELAINSWSDNQIKVTVDPNLLDILDQDNVILTVVTSGGQQSQKPNLKFHAMRREVLLRDLPKSQMTLAPMRDSGGLGVVPYSSSPFWGLGYSTAMQTGVSRAVADAEVNNADQGMTVGVDRNAWYRFSGGTDVYDFSKLKPGFYVSRFQLDGRNLQVCSRGVTFDIGISDETTYQDGSWNVQFYLNQNQIHVDWEEKHCHMSDGGNDSSNSTYGLNVWVKGPAIRPAGSPWQEGLK